MTGIKVNQFAYARLRSPDLGRAETFLTDLGLVRAHRTATALYMRGTDPDAFLHVTELGAPKVLGFGLLAKSEDDLKALSTIDGASGIEHPDEPGAGMRVRVKDPVSGFEIEVSYGRAASVPLPVDEYALNWGEDKTRRTHLMRPPQGPAPIKRIGHFVLLTNDIRKTLSWYRETFGLLASDDIYVGEPDNLVGSFNRIDRGDELVDHHCFFAIAGSKNGLNHISFEARDIDAIAIGHEHMVAQRHRHIWGVGRHFLGSNVFDYWADPWGRIHEIWADSDVLNASTPRTLWKAEDAQRNQWGPDVPALFIEHASH